MYYLDGMAVYNKEVVFSFMDLEAFKKIGSFYMIDKASPKRFEGWSLDSLSISKDYIWSFTNNQVIYGEYKKRVTQFLKDAIGV